MPIMGGGRANRLPMGSNDREGNIAGAKKVVDDSKASNKAAKKRTPARKKKKPLVEWLTRAT